jgi:hypothetical protein
VVTLAERLHPDGRNQSVELFFADGFVLRFVRLPTTAHLPEFYNGVTEPGG